MSFRHRTVDGLEVGSRQDLAQSLEQTLPDRAPRPPITSVGTLADSMIGCEKLEVLWHSKFVCSCAAFPHQLEITVTGPLAPAYCASGVHQFACQALELNVVEHRVCATPKAASHNEVAAVWRYGVLPWWDDGAQEDK